MDRADPGKQALSPYSAGFLAACTYVCLGIQGLYGWEQGSDPYCAKLGFWASCCLYWRHKASRSGSSWSRPGPSPLVTWASQISNLACRSLLGHSFPTGEAGIEGHQHQTSLPQHKEAQTEAESCSPKAQGRAGRTCLCRECPPAGSVLLKRGEARMLMAPRCDQSGWVRAGPALKTGAGDKEGPSHLLPGPEVPCSQGPAERPGTSLGQHRR